MPSTAFLARSAAEERASADVSSPVSLACAARPRSEMAAPASLEAFSNALPAPFSLSEVPSYDHSSLAVLERETS